MAFLHVLFYHLLKAPTLTGRKVMDQIEGFKMYLSVAEKDRLNLLNPPEKTPELFEKYLPYALALDVENEWSEQFAEILARAGTGSLTLPPGTRVVPGMFPGPRGSVTAWAAPLPVPFRHLLPPLVHPREAAAAGLPAVAGAAAGAAAGRGGGKR